MTRTDTFRTYSAIRLVTHLVASKMSPTSQINKFSKVDPITKLPALIDNCQKGPGTDSNPRKISILITVSHTTHKQDTIFLLNKICKKRQLLNVIGSAAIGS